MNTHTHTQRHTLVFNSRSKPPSSLFVFASVTFAHISLQLFALLVSRVLDASAAERVSMQQIRERGCDVTKTAKIQLRPEKGLNLPSVEL